MAGILTAGQDKAAIGSTAACAVAIIPAMSAAVNETVDFVLPAGWFFKVTVVAAAVIASAVQVTGL